MTDPAIKAHARKHIKEFTADITELCGHVIAKGMLGVLEECIEMHLRIHELEDVLSDLLDEVLTGEKQGSYSTVDSYEDLLEKAKSTLEKAKKRE